MIEVREYREEDIQELVRLWCGVFGDDENSVKAFFRLLPSFGSCAVCAENGKIVAMASIIEGMVEEKCAYIFAVAVAPDFRGLGLGKAVSEAAYQLAKSRGAQTVCTKPADEGLFSFYEKVLGFKTALFREKSEAAAKEGGAEKIGAAEYRSLREKLLEGKAHMSFPGGFIEYLDIAFTNCGGGLFRAGGGICACTAENGVCRAEEVISKKPDVTAAAAAAALGCTLAEYYLPSPSGEAFIAADRSFPDGTVFNLVCE